MGGGEWWVGGVRRVGPSEASSGCSGVCWRLWGVVLL